MFDQTRHYLSARRNFKCLFKTTMIPSLARPGIPTNPNIPYNLQCVFERAGTLCCEENQSSDKIPYVCFRRSHVFQKAMTLCGQATKQARLSMQPSPRVC